MRDNILVFLISLGFFITFIHSQCMEDPDYKFRLYDEQGNLMKKSCLVMITANYSEANNYCANQSMKLLNVNSAKLRTSFTKVVMQYFNSSNTEFRIDGVRTNGMWKVQNGTADFYTLDKADWVESPNTPKGDDNLCYANSARPFKKRPTVNYYFDGYPANYKTFFFCEYWSA